MADLRLLGGDGDGDNDGTGLNVVDVVADGDVTGRRGGVPVSNLFQCA
jgi:hypothetical protein